MWVPWLAPLCCCTRRTPRDLAALDSDDDETGDSNIDIEMLPKFRDFRRASVERATAAGANFGGKCCKGKKKYTWTAAFLLWAIATFLFLPREPTWEVLDLQFVDFMIPALRAKSLVPADTDTCPETDPCGEALAKGCSLCPSPAMVNDGCVCRGLPIGSNHPLGFFGGLSDFVSHLDDGSIITLSLQSTVVAFNPNLVGASTLPGLVKVFYREDLLGEVGVRPLKIPGGTSVFGGPQVSTNITVDVAVRGVTPGMGMEMLQEILANDYQLRIKVKGAVTAVAGPLQVQAHAECDLRASVKPYLHMNDEQFANAMNGTMPKTEFTERKCFYRYSL